MVDALCFKTGPNISGEQDRAQTLMLANGQLGDSDALDRGVSVVSGWVLDGRRVVSADDITKEVERMGLHADDPRVVMLVQAINRHPNPEDATVALDWVDLYEGDSPTTRRHRAIRPTRRRGPAWTVWARARRARPWWSAAAPTAGPRGLGMSEWTVQDHLKAVFAKFDVSSRGQLVATLFFDHCAAARRRRAVGRVGRPGRGTAA